MSAYSIVNLREVEDSMGERVSGIEGRFGPKHLDSEHLGSSYLRYSPGVRSPSAHSHREQEEAYVVISGSGQVRLTTRSASSVAGMSFGIPRERNGFVPVDEFGRVRGADGLHAAGDATTFPIKQGGIAATQADAAARSIAAKAGADVEPLPFRPVLRALLVSGERPTFMRVELGGGHGETSTVSDEAPWWPSGKIVGRYLSPFLPGLGVGDVHAEETDVVRIEIDFATAQELADS